MAYQSFNELLIDLALHTEEKHLPTSHEQVIHAVAEVQATDTKITIPWIYHILEKRKNSTDWDNVYRHWGEIHTLFGTSEDLSKKEKIETDSKEFKTLQQKKENLQNHIAETAFALQKIKITYDTLKDGILLCVTVIGLNKRFTDLDLGTLYHSQQANWLNTIKQFALQRMTKLIEYQTGHNRTDNFNPIYEAIHQLVNNNSILRKIIPSLLCHSREGGDPSGWIPASAGMTCEILDAPSIDPTQSAEAPKIDPIKSSKELDLDIKIQEKALSTRLCELDQYETEFKEIKYFVTRYFKLRNFNAFKDMLKNHIKEDHVIPYDTALLDYFELSEEESIAWKYYSKRQGADFFNKIWMDAIMLFQKQFIYPNPKEIMSVFSNQINVLSETILLQQKDILRIKKQIHLLKDKKNKMDVSILVRQTADQIKEQVLENKEKKHQIIHKKPWWKKILLPIATTALGAIIGLGIGFIAGTLIGIFFLLTASLCAFGGAIGLVIGTLSTKEKERAVLSPLETIQTNDINGRGNIHILKGLHEHPEPFNPLPITQKKSQIPDSINPIGTKEPTAGLRFT